MRPGDYIRSLFDSRDRVSLVALPRGEGGGEVLQRVYSAEVVAADRTQAWLRHLNANRHDLFLGANPVWPGAWDRTKSAIGDVMRVYLDIDEDGDRARPSSLKGLASRGGHQRRQSLSFSVSCRRRKRLTLMIFLRAERV